MTPIFGAGVEITQRLCIGKFGTNEMPIRREKGCDARLPNQATAMSWHGFEAADRARKLPPRLRCDSDNREIAVATRDLPKGDPAFCDATGIAISVSNSSAARSVVIASTKNSRAETVRCAFRF